MPVLGDCMMCDALKEAEIALYDIDGGRLEESYIMLEKINESETDTITKKIDLPF